METIILAVERKLASIEILGQWLSKMVTFAAFTSR